MRRRLSFAAGVVLIPLAIFGITGSAWGVDEPSASDSFEVKALGIDPGQPDTVYTTVDAPLVIPNGGGDVIIRVRAKTDNTGTGTDIVAFSIPIIVRSSNPAAQVYLADTTVGFTFTGTAVAGWAIKSLTTDSNHLNLGGLTFSAGLTSGTHLIANLKYHVTGPCTLSVDTLIFPLTPELTFGTSFAVEYKPIWKAANYPVACPTCPVNQAPVLAPIGSKLVNEGQLLSFRISATDPDGTKPVLTIANKPTNALFVDSGNGAGSLVWTPDFTQASVYNVKFKASDGLLSDSEIVQITVNNVNRPPVLAAIGAKSVNEGQTLSFKVTATDPDGNPITLTAVNKPTNSTFVDSSGGKGGFVFNPDFTQSGVYPVTFITNDGSLADSEIVQITVNNVNRPPALATIGSKSVNEGQTLSFKVTGSDPDGNIPSLSVPNPPANAVFVDSSNGAGGFVFNPDFNQANVYNVTFIASDGSLADTEVVQITVNDVNRPPVLAAIGAKSVNEGQTLSFKVTAADPDGNIPSLSVPNPPTNAVFVDSGNGAGGFVFNPDFTQEGAYPVTFIASDGSLADTEVVNITVNNVNRAPALDPIGPKSVQEENTLAFRVHASDPDGTTPSLSVPNPPTNAVFVDSGNGAGGFVFNPDNTQAGTYFVTFIASDGALADSETVTITVTETANQPPVLAPIGPKSVDEGQSLSFKVTATDPDGTFPALTVLNKPANANFVDSGNGTGGFTFAPDFTQAGVYPVTFIASDGSLADSEVVQITVNNANRAPVLAAIGPKSVDEGQTLSFKVTATDPDGTIPELTAIGFSPNANFVDSGNGSGGFVFTPDFTQSGVYNVTFIASDAGLSLIARTNLVNLTDTEVVQITVNNVNLAPVLDPIGPKTVQEGNTLTFPVSASDPDGSTPSLTVVNNPINSSFADSGNGAGGFIFNPDNTQSGTYFVTFIASDGSLADSETVTITVTEEANQPPVLAPIGPKSVDEGQALSFKVSATDPNGTIPALTALNYPPNANFVDSGNGSGGFTFSPDFTQDGVYNVAFIASDGSLADTEIVQITVNNVNRPPVLDPIGPKTVQEGNTLQFKVLASDPDGTIPYLNTSTLPAHAVFVDSGNGAGGFVFMPDNTQAGVYHITFYAADGLLDSVLVDSEVVTITVTEAANQPPLLAPIGPKSVDEGQTLSFKVTANDPDGTFPALTVLNKPANANFIDSGNGTGGFTFTPDFTQAGVYPVTFIASDGSLADSEVVEITVNNVNRPPVLDPIGPKSVAVGDTLAFKVHASDPDLDALTLTASGYPANANFVDSGNGSGYFSFIPQSGQAGVYNVKFKASDGSLADSEIVQITVTEGGDLAPTLSVSLDQNSCWPPNHKMVPVTATIVVNDDHDPDPVVVLYSVTSNEPDDAKGGGDGSTVNDIQDAQIGTLDFNISLRCERQGAGDGRTYTICYRATDNAGNSTTTCATFNVPHDQGESASSSNTTDYNLTVLEGNKPNPFNATTTISFNLPQSGSFKLSIYNLAGRLVREFSSQGEAGHRSVIWDGTDSRGNQVASGVYFYRLQAGLIMETRKMVLLR